jgi:hypothetical protein
MCVVVDEKAHVPAVLLNNSQKKKTMAFCSY